MNIMIRQEPDYLIPLTAVQQHVLLALMRQPEHGYGLRQQIAVDSNGILTPSTSTIYVALKSLTKSGFIAAAGQEKSAGSPHAKLMFELTPSGRDIAAQETERLADVVTLARGRLKAK